MAKFDYSDILQLEKYYRISLINKISGLRSANLIGTKNSAGQTNLAIFNTVTHIGANPPYLGFIMRPLTVERHTYANIKAIGYFTINQVTQHIHKQAHQTSAKFPSDISEFEACGLSEAYVDDFAVPFVEESPIKIGLSYQEEHRIEANQTLLMIGKVEKIILPDAALKADGDIDFEALDVISIGGLDSYYGCKRIGRYAYARANTPVKEI